MINKIFPKSILDQEINRYLVIILLILLSSISVLLNFNSLQSFTITEDAKKTAQYPYVDSACNLSKFGFMYLINNMDRTFNTQTDVIFYSNPSAIRCHGRPVISNANTLTPTKDLNIIAVGIGVNTLIDGIENVGKFVLLYVLLLFLFNSRRLNDLNIKSPNKYAVFWMVFVFFLYGSLVYTSFYNAIYNTFLALIFGNFIVYIIFNNYDIRTNLRAIVALSIFPLLFSNSNISFFWFFLLPCIDLLIKNKIRFNKFITISSIVAISFSTLVNVSSFVFTKSTSWADWILFTDHRHKGGIADFKNGSQSFAYVLDIFLIMFIFYILFYIYSLKSGFVLEDVSNGIIVGFIMWFISYFISQISTQINYLVFKFFGLPEAIDTISSVQPDGINWRGITTSWELTGIWLLIVFCILSHLVLIKRHYLYLPVLIMNIIAINFNTQRTVLILMVLFLVYVFLIGIKNKFDFKIFTLVVVLISILMQGPAGERLQSRLSSISFDYEISSALKSEISQSMKRFEKYNLNLDKPEYDFNTMESYSSFFSKEFNTDNKVIINSISALTKIFGREFQWFRFFYLTNLDARDLIFGHGAGQSHQELAVLIETPHSVYLTILFQFGIFGVLYFVSIFFFILLQFFKSKLNFVYLLGIFLFIGGIKTEFIMTHNQLVFYIMFITFLFFENTKKRDTQKI